MSATTFLHVAYGVVWFALAGYAADLAVRYVKLKRELRDLKK